MRANTGCHTTSRRRSVPALASLIEWMKTQRVLGYPVYNDTLDAIPISTPCRTVLTISPNSYGIATRDPLFREALKKADYLLLDGVYFALGSILRGNGGIRINNGPTAVPHLLPALSGTRGRVFFLRATDAT